jgi:transketolase
MLLYSLLHLFGYPLSIDDLKNFRQWGSKTPGHPEFGHTVGIEATTGPLGQGLANGVGMAIAEAFLADEFNREGFEIFNHYTYILSGDGCLMEGISYEAASLAGTLGLGKLILLYDSNSITIEGSTDTVFTEDVAQRFSACNWQVIRVDDGNNVITLNQALTDAKKEISKPSIIIVKTQIGYGCPQKVGTAQAHGEPLGNENIRQTKKFLNWPWEDEFYVPLEVAEHMNILKKKLQEQYIDWERLWHSYQNQFPQKATELKKWLSNSFLQDLPTMTDIISYELKEMATRTIGGEILNKLAMAVPNLFGGSADLNPSTKTYLKGTEDFSLENRHGRNLHFGIREHAMGAIANGIALHGGFRAFVSTFFVFSDYMKPAIRLAAIAKLPVIYIFTHDSIGVGEDGPTHQPIEQLSALRGIPGLITFRPADNRETVAGFYRAIRELHQPFAMILTRQNLPQLEASSDEAMNGGYLVLGTLEETPDIILMASGSEVHLIAEAGKILRNKGIKARVVSLPSWELFEMNSPEYRSSILPGYVRKRLAVEAGASLGWHKYIGLDGDIIAIDHFGASAPAPRLFKEYGFTVIHILERAYKLLEKK